MLNPLRQIGQLLEVYYTINERVSRLEGDMRRAEEGIDALQQATADLKARVAALEAEDKSLRATVTDLAMRLAELTTRVAVLEEARNTIDARVRAVISETVSEMRVQFIQAQTAQLPQPEAKPLPPAKMPTKRRRRGKNA